jgi:hypothetical protein
MICLQSIVAILVDKVPDEQILELLGLLVDGLIWLGGRFGAHHEDGAKAEAIFLLRGSPGCADGLALLK